MKETSGVVTGMDIEFNLTPKFVFPHINLNGYKTGIGFNTPR